MSHRADPRARPIADRHYNRQSIGAPNFVPPGRCLVLLTEREDALWVTSWPFAQYVRHAWAGAWINSLFRREDSSGAQASDMIREAIAATRATWTDTPKLGMVTFVDPEHVPPVRSRWCCSSCHERQFYETGRSGSVEIFGYSYLKAGFQHVGFTKGGLWAWRMSPEAMPDACAPHGSEGRLFA